LSEQRIKQALRMDMIREGLMQPTDNPTIREIIDEEEEE
jgi:hypothetical protein